MFDVLFDWVLSVVLWFVTYIQPLVLGARICRCESAKPSEVMNITLAIVFIWFAEFLDSLILGRVFAMRWLYVLARILLSWYWMHPRLMGALKLYQQYLQPLVERHAGSIDGLVTDHINEARHSGWWQYTIRVVGNGARSAHSLVSSALDTKRE